MKKPLLKVFKGTCDAWFLFTLMCETGRTPFLLFAVRYPQNLFQLTRQQEDRQYKRLYWKKNVTKSVLFFFCPLACACNNLGSLSAFCRSRDGQCQCRRNFQGQKCNECRIGFYDFPTCKACNCNPAGIKLQPGQTNGCGSVNNVRYNINRKVEMSLKQKSYLGYPYCRTSFDHLCNRCSGV